jgi:hypothetical protein
LGVRVSPRVLEKKMNKEDALKLLNEANIFFFVDDEDEPNLKQMINLNDVFGWAWADGEVVKDEDLVEVATLFREYGWCGIYYWVSKKRGGQHSEFLDINRFIDFVANEEALKEKEPDTDKRAYLKYKYTLGE